MFERFTEQARRAIFFSQYEAIFQSADKISPAHLLIGLTRDRGSRADDVASLKENTARLRSALGIPQAAFKAVPAAGHDVPLSDNFKMVLTYAAEEADFDQEYWIDSDSLLRGILRFPNEATDALQSISLDLDKARTASKRNRADFPPPSPPK